MMPSLLYIICLVLLSGTFSGTETAFTSLSFIQIKEMETSKKRGSSLAAKLAKDPDRLLTTILIGNNLVNIAASALTTTVVIELFGSYAVGYATGVLTLIILIFAEITPKQIAIIHNEWICSHTAYPILILSYILFPVIWIINTLSKAITRLFSGKGKKQISLQGIIHVVNLAERQGVVEDYESDLVKRVFRFDNIELRAIMTHRTEVFSIDEQATISSALPDVVSYGHSRVPVYSKHPEHISGVLLIRDLLKALNEGKGNLRVKNLMQPPLYVSENKRVHEMFFLFQSTQQQLAVVLDEYGGLAGIVTMEDIVEVLFGELYDEHETSEGDRITQLSHGVYLLQADTTIQQFQDYFHTTLDHSRHVSTIGGYITEVIGQIPVSGQTVNTPEGIFTVQRMTGNRIDFVRYTAKKASLRPSESD